MNNITESSNNWEFIEELKRPAQRKFHWERDKAKPEEADLSCGIQIITDFPDTDKILETAYEDTECFFTQARIKLDGNYKIISEYGDAGDNDSFRLQITTDSCKIIAENTEGIRRGLFYLQDMLLAAEGPFLKIGEIHHKSWIKNRISRCFFGPIKRPPFNHDELLDDVDCYPDEYLNRLAHEGVNGLWLTITFLDLCKTSITELNPDAEKRLEKLRRTVKQCLRYGIKTWAFCIEPFCFAPDDPLLQKYPELRGAEIGGLFNCFCPCSDLAQKYIYESVNWLFTQVPGLGGILNISHGERPTTCLSSVSVTENKIPECPRCSKLAHGEILGKALNAMQKGMHDASPSAQLISWLYMPQPVALADWVYDLPRHTPEDVILQFNFESGCYKKQLGQPRCGGDYWLSCIGPSDRFGRIAAECSNNNVQLSAKIQVGCSHEVASVPFVPVPGLLYRKYEKMRQAGASSVMQCWYFGNYPGLMNKAAGLLAYENFDLSENDFLLHLAQPDWGNFAERVVRAWQYFSEGYSHYPLSNQFQYYGPMHAGTVWPLYLKPALKSLAPTWKPDFPPSGDAIGECLENHTLEEAMILCEQLSRIWNQGVAILSSLKAKFNGNQERLLDIALAEALGIQFESGYNILKFYYLRKRLYAEPENLETLDKMERIVCDEISNSKHLAELCRKDSRLGFHSEAESYLYNSHSLLKRTEQLKNLLKTEFVEVRQRLTNNNSLSVVDKNRGTYTAGSGWFDAGNFRWQAVVIDEKMILKFECRTLENISFDRMGISMIDYDLTESPWRIFFDGENSYNDNQQASICEIKKDEKVWRAKVTLLKAPQNCYLQICRQFNKFGEESEFTSWPKPQTQPIYRLNLGYFKTENYGKFKRK